METSIKHSIDSDLINEPSTDICKEKIEKQETKTQNDTYDNDIVSQASEVFIEPTTSGKKFDLYLPDSGPKLYPVKGNIVTPPINTKNLPEAFKFMPVYGRPNSKDDIEDFYQKKIMDYVGGAIDEKDFKKLSNFCSPKHLLTGKEIEMPTNYPVQGPLAIEKHSSSESDLPQPGDNLCIVKKLKLRIHKDSSNNYPRKLKYRGLRVLPPAAYDEEGFKVSFQPLQPGKDLIFRVRVYRPFYHRVKDDKKSLSRHSIFQNDIILLGRQSLTSLRDRIVCPNDVSMRLDISENPEKLPTSNAKEVFPSGFLFINNVFYVDERAGCADRSAGVRAWAAARGLGRFARDRLQRPLHALPLRLGHPEVYVHQGNCEHLFTFSEVRLLNCTDPQRSALYPYHTAITQNQTLYCTTCAEFAAKWVVVECPKVPFDPAFFCDTCLKLYLYKDGKKIGNFKAYPYRGNEINVLKPLG